VADFYNGFAPAWGTHSAVENVFMREIMSLRILPLALTGALLFAGAAQATLPAATYLAFGNVYSGGNFKPLHTAGTVSLDLASATMGDSPSPSAEVHMALHNGEYLGGASAKIIYSFEVTGPQDVIVPLKAYVVASSVVDHTGNDAYGQYIVSVDAPQANGFGISNGGGSYGGKDSFKGYVDFTVMANQVNTVTVYATGYVNGTTTGHVDVYADPVFSFAGPTPGYSLSFSDGIGNASPAGVPEPASWALMLLGFGGLGRALRRRRAARLVATA
jgi:hypothetical protein